MLRSSLIKCHVNMFLHIWMSALVMLHPVKWTGKTITFVFCLLTWACFSQAVMNMNIKWMIEILVWKKSWLLVLLCQHIRVLKSDEIYDKPARWPGAQFFASSFMFPNGVSLWLIISWHFPLWNHEVLCWNASNSYSMIFHEMWHRCCFSPLE